MYIIYYDTDLPPPKQKKTVLVIILAPTSGHARDHEELVEAASAGFDAQNALELREFRGLKAV